MPFRWNPREHLVLGKYVLKWFAIACPVGMLVGSAVALFLWSLEEATKVRWTTDLGSGIPWLLFLLPVAGMAVALLYHLVGKSAEGGNNLVVEQIHDPGGGVPARMAPLILVATVITHLFGGSAGREGTAVQMGGSIASTLGRTLKLDRAGTRTLLMTGVAAGFGAVFGTPLTGAIFAVEVLAVGTLNFESIVPCLIASVAGDWTTSAWGIHHTHYLIRSFTDIGLLHSVPQLNWLLLGKVAVAAAAFGLVSVLFAEMAHGLQFIFKKVVPHPVFRPALGGVLVIALALLVGSDYLGIGVVADPKHPEQVSILSCFREGGATYWSWWWKTVFTNVTLSSGFKGGEVTPLFFIGAALGNAIGRILSAPVDLFAALGFIAVFAGASNTPLACTIMGVEIFAAGNPDLLRSGFAIYCATACFLSYILSGHSGIYLSQRIGVPKFHTPRLPAGVNLRAVRELQPSVGLARLLGWSLATAPQAPPQAHHAASAPQQQGAPAELEISQECAVNDKEMGQVRIYLTPGERRTGEGLGRFLGRRLYQEIIAAAKEDGLPNAAAHHTHYGYNGKGPIQSEGAEAPNERLTLCVELIGEREELELFCRKHGDLLKNKMVVYRHMERWEIS